MKDKIYYPGRAAFFESGLDFYLIYNFDTKKITTINKNDAFKYSCLTGIKSERFHLEDLLKLKDHSWDYEKYKKLLALLLKKDLYRPITNLENKIDKKNSSESVIAVITCNRPQLLSKALVSIAEGVSTNHPDIKLTVFDDSTDKETILTNIKSTAEINNKYGLQTLYFDKAEKLFFIKKLEAEIKGKGIDKKILHYTFFGNPELSVLRGGGGNRNAALLKLAGNKIISFDDDTQYNFKETTSQNNNLAISLENIPEINLFNNIIKTTNQLKNTDKDIIVSINEVLGENIYTLIGKTVKSDEEIISEDYIPQLVYSIENRNNFIKTAMFGIYGGKWYNSPFSIYLNNGSERSNSFTKKSGYSKIKKNPVSLMLPQCLNISKAPFLIATAFGIDARDITPPFPPQARADDNIWVVIMLALNKSSFIAHLPYAVWHDIENKNQFLQKNYDDTSAGFGLITVLIIEHLKRNLHSLFPEITYEILGNEFIALSKIDDEQFINICHDLWLEYTGITISQLENLIIKYDKMPKHWTKDVEKYISLFEKQSVNPENSLPRELREHYTIGECMRLYKLFFKDYGELIKYWPLIWDTAMEVNKRGNSIF